MKVLINKTNQFQSIAFKDGSMETVRPYRTVLVDDNTEFNRDVFEEQVGEKKVEKVLQPKSKKTNEE